MIETAADIPVTMSAVLLVRHGGLDALEHHHDVPVPEPTADEVLIRVGAAGVNNTDINTRTGWYAKSDDDAGSWSGEPLGFPRIQGADVCGRIVAVGADVDPARLGERVIVATMQPVESGGEFDTTTLGSEMDGGFADYMVTRSSQAYAVDCEWTDVELASVPCASSTAENMLHRIGVSAGEHVLITGASGGVGTAAVQLAKRRGAHVIAVAADSKADAMSSIGADTVIDRDADLLEVLGHESVDVIIDVVAGPSWPQLLDVLRRGGRYVTSGAIAGPLVELDVRTLYLKDLTLAGATAQAPSVLPDLVGYIERGEIRPLVAATYPRSQIARAQTDFMAKGFVGKLVLTPDR